VLYQTCNTRSWKSYEAVARDIAASLERIGFRHVHLMPDDMQLADRLRREQIHMAWLNTGGVQGYNSAAHAASTECEMIARIFGGRALYLSLLNKISNCSAF